MRWLALCVALPFTLIGAPKGFRSSTATLISDGNKTTIKSGKSAIVQWDEFSIGKGEHVYFLQASSKSKVLNRVTGNKLSEIHGTLESNGQVYLINPAGVYIGKEGRIQCAAFYASTLEMSEEQFLRSGGEISGSIQHDEMVEASQLEVRDGKVLLVKEKHFQREMHHGEVLHPSDQVFVGDSKAPITHLGKIETSDGNACLLAHTITNDGDITTRKWACHACNGAGFAAPRRWKCGCAVCR